MHDRMVIRSALACVAVLTLTVLGFYGMAWGAPAAFLSTTTTNTSPGQENFTAPVHGHIGAWAGGIYANGIGSMFDTDVYANKEKESMSVRGHSGVIVDVDFGLWVLNAEYDGSVLAKSHYVPTGLVPKHEHYWARARGTCEMRGDFGNVISQRVVKAIKQAYPLDPRGSFDAKSVIVPGESYSGGGLVTFKEPDAQGIALDEGTFGGALTGLLLGVNVGNGVPLDFTLAAHASHVLHNFSEEDVSLTTKIGAGVAADGSDGKGWAGNLEGWDVNGDLTYMVLLQSWPFGN